jgi:hypothetical protein
MNNVPQMPHSLEAEESLLSCCILDGADVLSQCHEARIAPESFYDAKHGVIYQALLSLYNRQTPVDIAVLAEELKTSKQLDAIGGYPFLTQVSGRIPTTAQAGFFIGKVREQHALRELIRRLHVGIEGAGKAGANADEIIADVRTGLEAITEGPGGLGAGITAASLCAKPLPRPPELVAGILYGKGTMMLSGPSKSRKTYTFLDLGLSVATGTAWLGFPTKQAGVIYLNFELSEHSFCARLVDICAAKGVPPPANFRSFNLRGRRATMGLLAAELPRLIRTHSAGLVILDPWYKIAAQSGAEENSNDGQARILAEAERIATANGAALVVGHHFAKGDASAKNSIDRAAGAGAMARWGDVIATLSEHKEPDAMTLEMHLRDFAPVSPIVLRWDQPLWRRDDSLDPANLKRPAGRGDDHPASQLLGMLAEPMTNTEWRTASGWPDSTFRRKRDELVSGGKVICQMGVYRRV